ncbi:beta and beta-prime subunits of DNA dependent RNA-polymerase, partial [Tuber magnatum]
MNISNPVASEVTGVNFTFLCKEDITKLSVKQIVNPATFETVIPGKVPVPVIGGLYDPALGASDALRQRCSTCHLDYKYCPGHVGHISLPVPVYHPLFFDQMLKMLRSSCLYCFHFRMARAEVNRFECKLTLIQYGLLVEAAELDDIHPKVRRGGEGEEDEIFGSTDMEAFYAKRERFVAKAIRRHLRSSGLDEGKVMSVAEERRKIVKEFLSTIQAPRKCNRCQAQVSPVARRIWWSPLISCRISPGFRKDGYSKIFELPLGHKAQNQNAQFGFRRPNAAAMQKKPNGIQEAQDRKGAAGRLLHSMEVLNNLSRLFEKERGILQLLYQPREAISKTPKTLTPDMFFIHTIAVPPTKFRPPQAAGGEISESATNKQLVKILQACLTIRDYNDRFNDPETGADAKPTIISGLMQAFVTLQDDVNSFLDSSKSPLTGAALRTLEEGIKQKLERKEGLFRMNMMGKRVNFAARSVISPDPNIETREIGVPPVFARKLTYPEPVTEINHQWLMRLRIHLSKTLLTPDALCLSDSKSKKVHRHLLDGDVVLMNR